MKTTRLLAEMTDYETALKSRFLRVGPIGGPVRQRQDLVPQCYQVACSVAEESVVDIGRQLETDALSDSDLDPLFEELAAVLHWHAPPFCHFGPRARHETQTVNATQYGIWVDELQLGNADYGVIHRQQGWHDVALEDVGLVRVDRNGWVTVYGCNESGEFEPEWAMA